VFQVAPRHGRGLLMLAAAVAIAISACSGGTATPSTGATTAASTETSTPQAATASPTLNTGPGLAGAVAAMGTMTSYQYTMTLAGGTFDDMYSMVGGSPSSNAAYPVKGTVVQKPATSEDLTIGDLHIVETGGSDYIDMGKTGSFTKTDVQGAGLTDQWTPVSVYSGFNPSPTGYDMIGSETKNGVQTDHYQATKSALAELGSIAGVDNATWTADIWLDSTGGYPVAVSVTAKAADNSVAYEIVFNLTKIDDPSNTVTAPANVTGA
jgi:hypothetical protein